MNDTTKNLIKAIQEYKPLKAVEYVYKAIYDDSGKVTKLTYEETNEQHIIITKEEFEKYPLFNRLYIINGKLVEKEKNYYINKLNLADGERWFTSKSNMLIMGNEKGWDERRNN